MASTHKHIRSSTADKRPTTAIADGQIALNTNSTSPGLFFKDSTGATIIKIGPVHVGATAPNVSPAVGGSSGNSTGEVWLDNSLTPVGVKIWNGSAWVNATPIGSTTVQGLLELATDAETQTGVDTARAVTPASLQSKVSDSTSTTSSTTIASSTAVKSAYDLANAALPKSGGTITGNLEIGTAGSLSFEGATADGFETTIAVTDPTADRTITLPDVTGTVVTTGDTGTVTSTMIADGTIVNGDINASAAIAHSKLANITAGSVLLGNASNVPTATALSGDVTVNSSGVTAISSGVIVNADVNASAAIAGTKISPDFGSQTVATTGLVSTGTGTAGAPTITFTGDTNTGIYSPGADQVAISTNGTGRLFVDASGNIKLGASAASGFRLAVDGDTWFGNQAGTEIGRLFNDAGVLCLRASSNVTGLGLATNSSSSHAIRIDSSGRVGLGTSSPSNTAGFSQQLEVAGNLPCVSISNTGTGANKYSLGVNGVGALGIWDNTASAFRMYINSSGQVGIGTTTPGYPLDVSGQANIKPAAGYNALFQQVSTSLRINYLNDAASANVSAAYRATDFSWQKGDGSEIGRFDSSGRLLVGTSSTSSIARARFEGATSGSGGVIDIARSSSSVSAGSTIGLINFTDNTATPRVGALIIAEGEDTWNSNDYPTRLVFSTTADGASSPTERMRIDNLGRTNVFSSDNGFSARVSAGAGTGTVTYVGYYSATSTTTGTVSFQVFSNGNVQNTNNSYTAISDIKLKENIVDAGSQWADLKALRVRNYNLKEGQTHRQIGLVAQEVEPISPGLVYETPDRDEDGNDLGTVTKSVNYSVLYMKAVKALQEAMERIETLEAKVAALEAQ